MAEELFCEASVYTVPSLRSPRTPLENLTDRLSPQDEFTGHSLLKEGNVDGVAPRWLGH